MPAVKLYANLQKHAGTKELSITGATFRAMVNELVRQKPSVGEMILKNGEIGPHVIVTLNGHNVVDLKSPVREQDIIAIFPPTAGGQGKVVTERSEKVLAQKSVQSNHLDTHNT